MVETTEKPTEDLESTGFATENITRTLDGTPAETAAFEMAYEAVETARKQTDVLAADIYRHHTSLRAGDGVHRTSEMQATLSLEGIEKITDDLIKARDALVAVLIQSGEGAD